MEAPRSGPVEAAACTRPFRGREAVASGLVTPGRLRGPRYRRVFRGVHVPAALPLDLETRSRAAYLLVEGQGGVLAGYSAALLLGADVAPRDAPAEVLARRHLRPRPGLRVGYGVVTGADLARADGCAVTSAARTAWDLARRLPLVEAVVAVDALGRIGQFAPSVLLERRHTERGARGCRRLADVVALSDPGSESPPESRLRVALVRAGLPAPAVQYPVFDEWGWLLARVDLAYPDALLAVEYDGAHHFTPQQTRRDRYRDSVLAALGWHTVRTSDADLGPALPGTVDRIARLRTLRTAVQAPSSHPTPT